MLTWSQRLRLQLLNIDHLPVGTKLICCMYYKDLQLISKLLNMYVAMDVYICIHTVRYMQELSFQKGSYVHTSFTASMVSAHDFFVAS